MWAATYCFSIEKPFLWFLCLSLLYCSWRTISQKRSTATLFRLFYVICWGLNILGVPHQATCLCVCAVQSPPKIETLNTLNFEFAPFVSAYVASHLVESFYSTGSYIPYRPRLFRLQLTFISVTDLPAISCLDKSVTLECQKKPIIISNGVVFKLFVLSC